jgi:hypothetical protein
MCPCLKCGIDEIKGAIHEHHLNGDHGDNSPENKILLCANCHHTLHWGRWKLSDIGYPDVEIVRKRKEIRAESAVNCEVHMAVILKLIDGIVYYQRRLEFEREKHRYLMKNIIDFTLEGLLPYPLREKVVQFEWDIEINFKPELQRELNLHYQRFYRDLPNLPELKEVI